MAKKRSASSVQDKHLAKSVKHLPDSELDFSDIPELTEEELSRARPVGRPRIENPKSMIAIRLSPSLIFKLKKLAKKKKRPYQTLMHEILEKGVKSAA